MISIATLNPDNIKLSPQASLNFARLYIAVRELEIAYGYPFEVSSGIRSLEQHQAIYNRINARRKTQGLEELQVPMKSRHLAEFSAAVDIKDPNQKLQKFILKNIPLVEELGLYLEAFEVTPTWCHLQCLKPASGNRFFIP